MGHSRDGRPGGAIAELAPLARARRHVGAHPRRLPACVVLPNGRMGRLLARDVRRRARAGDLAVRGRRRRGRLLPRGVAHAVGARNSGAPRVPQLLRRGRAGLDVHRIQRAVVRAGLRGGVQRGARAVPRQALLGRAGPRRRQRGGRDDLRDHAAAVEDHRGPPSRAVRRARQAAARRGDARFRAVGERAPADPPQRAALREGIRRVHPAHRRDPRRGARDLRPARAHASAGVGRSRPPGRVRIAAVLAVSPASDRAALRSRPDLDRRGPRWELGDRRALQLHLRRPAVLLSVRIPLHERSAASSRASSRTISRSGTVSSTRRWSSTISWPAIRSTRARSRRRAVACNGSS